MAVAVTTAFWSSVTTRELLSGEPANEGEGEPLFVLSQSHVQELRTIATGVEESDAGVCCRYLVDQLSSASPDVDDDGYEHHLEAVERFCDRYEIWLHPHVSSWRNRVRRARRALDKLSRRGDRDAVAILHVAYGYPDPLARQLPELVPLGDLASLARYTDVVEERRVEMARAEAARTDDATSLAYLVGYRDRLEWALRATSSGDALRAALAPPQDAFPVQRLGEGRGEFEARCEAFRERKARHKDRVEAFVSRVRRQSAEMLSRAAKAYHRSWLESAV